MKTLTIHEASSNLATWLEQALAGEDIGIRSGNAVVVLRPAGADRPAQAGPPLSPREALRCLQHDARMTAAQAESYLRDLQAERLAAEDSRTA